MLGSNSEITKLISDSSQQGGFELLVSVYDEDFIVDDHVADIYVRESSFLPGSSISNVSFLECLHTLPIHIHIHLYTILDSSVQALRNKAAWCNGIVQKSLD